MDRRSDLRVAGDLSTNQPVSNDNDGLWTAETSHDPFLPHMLIAEHTERISMGTGIAVAFARTPMNLAVIANDGSFHRQCCSIRRP